MDVGWGRSKQLQLAAVDGRTREGEKKLAMSRGASRNDVRSVIAPRNVAGRADAARC